MGRAGRWSTQATVGLILVVVGLAALTTVLALSIPAGSPLHPGGSPLPTGQVSGASLGERIFLAATDENGRLIRRSGVTGMMGSRLVCANCHGSDARGRTIRMMMAQVEAPDIRWGTLSQPMQDPDGGLEPAYDPRTFARAVRDGIGSDGRALDPPMPRWDLTAAQVEAIIAFLKTK